LIKKSID